MENSLTVPWNGNHRVYDPAIQLLEIYPEEMKRSAQKNYTSVCNSIIRKSQKSVCTYWWVHKQNVIYLYNGALFGNVRKWNTDKCYSINEPSEYYAKINKSETKNGWFHLYKMSSIGKS